MTRRNPIRRDGNLATWRLHDLMRAINLDYDWARHAGRDPETYYVNGTLKVDELKRILLELMESRGVTIRNPSDTFY